MKYIHNVLSDCNPGSYIVLGIEKDIDYSFLSALSSIGLTKGQVVDVLESSTKKELFLVINEAKYLLRRKSAKYVKVKKF